MGIREDNEAAKEKAFEYCRINNLKMPNGNDNRPGNRRANRRE